MLKRLYAKLNLSYEEIALINRFLDAKKCSDFQGEDNTISNTVSFSDGMQMDIKCCGCQDGPSWCEAVLFDKNGVELACSEVEDEYTGNWLITYDGLGYLAYVLAEPELNNAIMEGREGRWTESGRKTDNGKVYCLMQNMRCGDSVPFVMIKHPGHVTEAVDEDGKRVVYLPKSLELYEAREYILTEENKRSS